MAKLRFLGAVEGVTGSLYLLETQQSKILLDCGLFQGSKTEEKINFTPLPLPIDDIDAVVLSHAHLDHSGRLPLLAAAGFKGQIYMTGATRDLIGVLLKDAAAIQERDAEWENKRRKRSGKKLITPLYTENEVERALSLCVTIPYGQRHQLTTDVTVVLADAGHILGSSIVQVFVNENGQEKSLVYSGDLGNSQAALLRDPQTISKADVLLLESTYGDRNHRSMDETLQEFEHVFHVAAQNGGNVIIPSFAVGRTQEILFRLGELYQQGKLPQQAVFLDSPMAIAVTEIYHRYQDVYNQEDRASIKNSSPKLKASSQSLHSFLPILRYATTTEESMAINNITSGAIIIAGSGMCNGGRIRHHLKHNLWRQKSHIVFVGYQANGTPGRSIVDGTKRIKFAGEQINVQANIHTLGGFSAHASQSQLLEWLSHFDCDSTTLFLVHGESNAKLALKAQASKIGWQATIPELNQQISF